MKKIYLIIAIIVLNSSCDSSSEVLKEGKTYKNFRGFEPTDATEYDAKVSILVNDALIDQDIKLLKTEQILAFLNNETVLVSIGQIDYSGGITYIPVTLSVKGSSYKITMDYMKFTTLGQVSDGKFLGYKRVGVGLRLISQITTFESGINIGDLSSIGVAAKAGKLNGTLMIEVIGIKSKEVTTLLPLPSEINQTTIQSAMQALATIKSKIYDTDTKLYPQVMAIKINDSSKVSESKPNKTDPILNEVKQTEDKVRLQFENNSPKLASVSEAANQLVTEAFQFFFAKDVEQAISKFDQCEKVYPQYYSVFEINQLLKSNRENLKSKTSPKWPEISSTLLERYSWKLSKEIKAQLKIISGK